MRTKCYWNNENAPQDHVDNTTEEGFGNSLEESFKESKKLAEEIKKDNEKGNKEFVNFISQNIKLFEEIEAMKTKKYIRLSTDDVEVPYDNEYHSFRADWREKYQWEIFIDNLIYNKNQALSGKF